ncbi:SH3 domain-containing protein [Streptomyces sp. NPDC001351]|uniref:SH3 domain-containing protein n=1 Tax=Streptomyces sp. NPDC001351 TaxID=3364564 RepID=UPI0036BF3180
MKISHKAVYAVAASVLGLTMTAVGVASTAGTAQAASLPQGCGLMWQDYYKTTENVNLRKGPGTKYTSLGILTKGTRIYMYCNKDLLWYYGKVTSGANKGKKGWVSAYYIRS